MKIKSKAKSITFKRTIASLVVAALFSQGAYALPGAATFTKGAGTVSTAGSNMTINVTTVDNKVAAANFQGFNIATGESVHVQNSASSSAITFLAIDNSGLQSLLNGTLTSNGGSNATSVALISAGGIAVGPNANIQTGGAFSMFAGNANTINTSDGNDIVLPNGVKVEVALTSAPITIDNAATIAKASGVTELMGANRDISLIGDGSGTATLPYLNSGSIDLITGLDLGTVWLLNNSRLSDATYYLGNGSRVSGANNLVDGNATLKWGAEAGSANALIYGIGLASGSADLQNTLIKGAAGNTTTSGLVFINTKHSLASAGGDTGNGNSIYLDGVVLDSTNGYASILDASQYSERVDVSTAQVLGVGSTVANNQFIVPLRGFMTESSGNRVFNGSNISMFIKDKTMTDNNFVTPDGTTGHTLDGSATQSLILNLDSTSLFNLVLGDLNLFYTTPDIMRAFRISGLTVATPSRAAITWGGAQPSNLLQIVGEISTSGSDFNITPNMASLDLTGQFNSGSKNILINAGHVQLNSATLTSGGTITVKDNKPGSPLIITNSNVNAAKGINIQGMSGMTIDKTNIVNTTSGNVVIYGNSFDLTNDSAMVGTTVSNAVGDITVNGQNLVISSAYDNSGNEVVSSFQTGAFNNVSIQSGGDGAFTGNGFVTTGNFYNGGTFGFNMNDVLVNANNAYVGGGADSYYEARNYNVNNLRVDGGANVVSDVHVVNNKALNLIYAKVGNSLDIATRAGDLNVTGGTIENTAVNNPNAIILSAGIDTPKDTTGTGGNVKVSWGMTLGSGSNFVIYSGNPTNTTLTNLTVDRKRYNNDYSDGDYYWSLLGNAAGNRVYYRNTPSLTINPTAGQSKTYGDADPANFAYSVSGLQPGDSLASIGLTGSLDRALGENAGTYLYGIGTLANDMGYVLNLSAGSFFTINPKALLASGVVANSKVYDGNTATNLSGGALSGVVGVDDVALDTGAASASFADKNVGTGKTVSVSGLGLTGTAAGNYVLSNPTATTTADITARDVNISGTVVDNKVYDGNTTAPITTYANVGNRDFVAGDAVALNTSGVSANFADKNVGTGKTVSVSGYALSGADAGNYHLVSSVDTATADITAKTLNITGTTANSKTYDATTAATLANAGALSGAIAGDSVSVDTSAVVASFADKNAGTGKTVSITGLNITGTDAGNYVLASSSATTTADIAKKAISSSGATVADKTYDGTVSATITGLGSTTGVIAGDTVGLTGGVATFADKNAGSNKVVSISGITLNGADAANYSIAGTDSATANIAQKNINGVSGATVANKTYDGNNTATITNAGSAIGVVAGDAVSLTATDASFSDKNAGTGKTVSVNGLALTGADAANYNLTVSSTSTTADIAKKALGLAGTVASDKVYDGNTSATITNPGALSGVIAGDAVAVDTTGMSASFADKNVGTNKAISVSGLTLSGADAANYTAPTASSATASITAKSITVNGVVAADKTYDGTTAATLSGGVANGVIAGDAVSVVLGSGSFADKNAGAGKTVNITGSSISGADAGNYVASFQSTTTANIGQASLTIAAVADTKVVDGSTGSNKTPVVTGLQVGDSVNATQSFSGSTVGAQTLTVNYAVLDGNGGNNYVVSAVDAAGVINAAPVVPPVVVPPAVAAPVVVHTTRIEASSDVSTPTMRADTVLVPTGNTVDAAPSITQAPVIQAVAPVAPKKDEKK